MNRLGPVEITYKNMRFLIARSPSNASLSKFSQELQNNKITTVVRVCEATYNAAILEEQGIQVLDWPYGDGESPPSQIVDKWLNFVRWKFHEEVGSCIAVHCMTGLGRSPVLVALALIECGMKQEDAIQFIRQKCRGAFNNKQLLYLQKYCPTMCLHFKNTT